MMIKPGTKPGHVVMDLKRREDELLAKSVEEATSAEGWPFQLKRMLVPIDFSAFSAKALEYAIPLAERFAAVITLVYVVEWMFYTGNALAPVELNQVNLDMTDQGRKKLESLGHENIKDFDTGNIMIRQGKAHHEIIEAAKSMPADLIVIATHGHTGLRRLAIGSTTELVVRHAPCPVLVVRARQE